MDNYQIFNTFRGCILLHHKKILIGKYKIQLNLSFNKLKLEFLCAHLVTTNLDHTVTHIAVVASGAGVGGVLCDHHRFA